MKLLENFLESMFIIVQVCHVTLNIECSLKFFAADSNIVLQDDFLPRTSTPLEDMFKSLFWYTATILFC